MVARRSKEEPTTNGNGKGKIKFRYMDSERVVDFSVENMAGDQVTDGLHSIANALAGRTLPRQAPPNPKRTLAGRGASTVDVEEQVENPEDETPEQEVLEPEEEESGEETSSKPKRDRPKPKTPKLLTTPNLTEAKVPLADFMKQKNVTEMMDKYAAVAVWYKEQFQIVDMNIDRIFSAFKVLGQESQLPTDIEKPLKNLTYVKKWFEKAKAPNTYNIIWLGESEVGKMGAGAAKA